MRRLPVGMVALVGVAAIAGVAAWLTGPEHPGAAQPRPPSTASPEAVDAPAPAGGQEPPDVVFEHFAGGPARLSDWQGTPLVVNFWASWCPPCVAEMRDVFEPAHRELDGRVTLLGVNLQDGDEAARDVVERTGVTYGLARDPQGELFVAFGGFGMPTTVFVDADGRVAAQHTGALTRPEFDALVRDHLLDG